MRLRNQYAINYTGSGKTCEIALAALLSGQGKEQGG